MGILYFLGIGPNLIIYGKDIKKKKKSLKGFLDSEKVKGSSDFFSDYEGR